MILAGSTAIVTGGAKRIGREICLALAEDGVNVCVHYGTSTEAAEKTVKEIQGLGVQSIAVQADLSDPMGAASKIVETAHTQLGETTILVNCAAIFESARFEQTSEESWDRHLNINLKLPFFLTQAFIRQLSPNSEGTVVNLLDWRALRPVPGHTAYTIAKAALAAQTRLLAQELGPRVRVNGIAPGAILPPPEGSTEEFQKLAAKNPLQRTGNPLEIVAAMRYLLLADFVTGEVLHVTGGEQL
ncbi:MAG: SDR family oxidoreductase [Planctomycetaceae bacterium]|nr:SDR family oxidoreductase [Planctomycetaceae bacterium]